MKHQFEKEIGYELSFDPEYGTMKLVGGDTTKQHYAIKDLIYNLQELVKDGATHVKFGGIAGDYCLEEVTIQGVTLVEETDEEYQTRITDEELSKEKERIKREKDQLALYELLKSKFENK